jgi:hypothetical protein
LSSRWLRAVPRALVAWRFLPVPVFAGLVGLALVSGCGEVTSGGPDLTAAAGPPEIDASFGGSSNSNATDGASSCHPSDVQALQGTYQPAAVPSGACLGADGGGVWEDFFEACLGPDKSDAKCDAYKETPSNAACAACVLTPYTADQLGPILSFGEFVGGNVAGCIEVTSPRELPCAQAVQALSDCEDAACQANCPVTDPQSLMERQNCASQADQMGLCFSLSQKASACRAAEADGGLASPCMNVGFKAFYDVVVPLFCGQANVDAAAQLDAGSADAALGLSTDSGAHATDAGTD